MFINRIMREREAVGCPRRFKAFSRWLCSVLLEDGSSPWLLCEVMALAPCPRADLAGLRAEAPELCSLGGGQERAAGRRWDTRGGGL